MLPVTHSESTTEAAQRQANFIVLRSLESKIPKDLFNQVVATVSPSIELPMRIDWTGHQKPLSFEEVKRNFPHVDEKFLPQLLQQSSNQNELTEKSTRPDKNSKIEYLPQTRLVSGIYQNMMMSHKCLHLQNYAVDQKRNLSLLQISRFERMKTIFGHALIEESFNAPIYNVMFDQTGDFVLSGADDGIIKIWDKKTLSLQASLHSHQDVITDMAMSRCNKYLATTSKDGQLLVWDWKNCQKVDQFAAHASSINNVKFFELKCKTQSSSSQKQFEFVQILMTCSDDGTIKIYDEVHFLNSQPQTQTSDKDQKRVKRQEASSQKKERYSVILTPEDYRPGAKNKKIDSMNINHQGLIAAGTSTGEVFLWNLDIQKFKQQHQKPYTWLGSSKKHTKIVHFCEFSPSGKHLFTGSVDGTAKIWDIDHGKQKKEQQNQLQLTESRLQAVLEEKRTFGSKFGNEDIYFINEQGQRVNLSQYRQQRNTWQCDSITWSCNGRYAIASLSGKVETNRNQQTEYSILKIWDSFTGEYTQDLAQEASKHLDQPLQLLNCSFVLAAHPKMEEILISGSDGGLICLWNIKTKTLIKQFLEYGIYSYEKYTMSNPFDGKFSPDGTCFVVGSELGNISLFSNSADKFRYYGTRIEQFFGQDNIKHPTNIYYDQQDEPYICDYNLVPYAPQPPSSLVGKFKNARQMTTEEYETNLLDRQRFCIQQEAVLQESLSDALRNAMYNHEDFNLPAFDPNALLPMGADLDLGNLNQNGERGRLNSQISQISQNQNNQMGSQEDQEILNGINQVDRPPQLGGRRRGRPRNIQRNLQQQDQQRSARPQQEQHEQMRFIGNNIDPDNSFYDRQSDENFELEEDHQSFEEESDEIFEDENDGDYRNNHAQRDRENRLRLRNQDEERKRQQVNDANSRAMRAQKRQNQPSNNQRERNTSDGRKKRRTVVMHEGDSSQNDHSDDENFDDKQRFNGKGGKRRRAVEDSESNQDMFDDDSEDEQGVDIKIQTRNQRNMKKRDKKEHSKGKKDRTLRNRANRKTYENMDESEDDDYMMEEEKLIDQGQGGKSSTEKRLNRVIKSEDEDDNIVDYDVQMPDQYSKKQKGDEDFEIELSALQNQANNFERVEGRICEFCKRYDPPLIGPFTRVKQSKSLFQGPYFFHKDCIEVNNYSFYSSNKEKWLNIGKALETFSRSPAMCQRCNQIGATIKCMSCDKHFHGFLCSSLHMILLDRKDYQCFTCRNAVNYKNFFQRDNLIDKTELKMMKRQMPRDHLLISHQSLKSYCPQLNDLVVYFFQGHEKFMSCYNCFFNAGDREVTPIQPWKEFDQLEEPTICRVKSLSHTFPSKRALYLIKNYGKFGNPNQVPQVVTQIELQIIGNENYQQTNQTFTVEIFPNELPDFLVPKKLYEKCLQALTQLQQENKLVNQVFKSRLDSSNQVKIEAIREKEPSYYETNWESILYRLSNRPRINQRGRRGQAIDGNQEDELPLVMNFWELYLDSQESIEDDFDDLHVKAFSPMQKQQILDIIQNYCKQKADITFPFMKRVTKEIAPDYLQHIQAEMYLNLIQDRVFNDYYRSVDVNPNLIQLIYVQQLYFDLDLMHKDCHTYNQEGDLPKNAKKIVENLKSEIRKQVAFVEDTKRSKFEENKIMPLINSKAAGKLTVPVMKTESTMDNFRRSLAENDSRVAFKKEAREEVKFGIAGVAQNQQKNKKASKSKHEDFSYAESYDSLEKITPKTPISSLNHNSATGADQMIGAGGARRQTRLHNNARSEKNDIQAAGGASAFGCQFSTGEKYVPPFKNGGPTVNSPILQQDGDQANILGKRTRSGRQTRTVKQSLNEDELDKEFEEFLGDENELRKRSKHRQQF